MDWYLGEIAKSSDFANGNHVAMFIGLVGVLPLTILLLLYTLWHLLRNSDSLGNPQPIWVNLLWLLDMILVVIAVYSAVSR